MIGFEAIKSVAADQGRLAREREERRRRDDHHRLAGALAAEIGSICSHLKLFKNTMGRLESTGERTFSGETLRLFYLRPPVVYPAVADQLGLLSPSVAALAVTFYGTVNSYEISHRMTMATVAAGDGRAAIGAIKPLRDALNSCLGVGGDLSKQLRNEAEGN